MRRMLLLSILAMLVAASLAGCSDLVDRVQSVPPASTPDVEATVTARLQEERSRAAVPTPNVEATVTARLLDESRRAATPTPLPEAPSEARAASRLMPSVVRLSKSDSMGSGLVIGEGLILTNRHVVEDANTMDVQTSTGQTYAGTVVARNSILDLALIQFPGVSIPAATFADISRMKPGEPVLAVGYPLDMKGDASVTRGLFSAIRTGEPAPGEWVQTDAAVNPGNSGGPLANLRGEVVGLITLKRTWEGYNPVQGINFALSATSIRELLPAMHLAAGSVPPDAQEASPELAREVADFLKQYDEAEIQAYSNSDPTPLEKLASPGLHSRTISEIREQKELGVRVVSKLLDFQMKSAYTLPGDLVVAGVTERWETKYYRGNTLIEDTGDHEVPQIPVVKRTADGWRLVAVQFLDTDEDSPSKEPTPGRRLNPAAAQR